MLRMLMDFAMMSEDDDKTNWLDFEDDTMLTWDLSLPDDVVEGSARAWITAVGDLMGPALQVIHPSIHPSIHPFFLIQLKLINLIILY